MHVSPACIPPPIRKFRYGRLILNGGEVERPGRCVAAVERVDQALALESAHRHLAGERAMCRPGAEGRAGGLPVPVGLALEVGDQDVIASLGESDRDAFERARPKTAVKSKTTCLGWIDQNASVPDA